MGDLLTGGPAADDGFGQFESSNQSNMGGGGQQSNPNNLNQQTINI
jgi:hypothetical protein